MTHVAMGEGAEFDAIRRMLATWGSRASGIGDDAAIVDVPHGERLVVSTDASIDRVHFRREWMSAREIGARAATAALSDLAAMAAMPRGLLLSLGLPPEWRDALDELAAGVGDVAARADCPIVGGNISSAGELSLTITVLGSCASPVTRDGASPGDIIFVTGLLGGSGAGLDALLRGTTPRTDQRTRFVAPGARLHEARWLAQRGMRACIDISDGLLNDAAHLARASGVTIDIDAAAVPCMPGVPTHDALGSAEEYELLAAIPATRTIDVAEFEREFGIRLTAIGVAMNDVGIAVTQSGAPVALRGHDHLA